MSDGFRLNISRFSVIMLMRYPELLLPKDKPVFLLQEALGNQETTRSNVQLFLAAYPIKIKQDMEKKRMFSKEEEREKDHQHNTMKK